MTIGQMHQIKTGPADGSTDGERGTHRVVLKLSKLLVRKMNKSCLAVMNNLHRLALKVLLPRILSRRGENQARKKSLPERSA